MRISAALSTLAFFATTALANRFSDTGHTPKPETFSNKYNRAVGRIYDQRGSYTTCTATLVTPDIIVTAAHCLIKEGGTRKDGAFRFVPSTESAAVGESAWLDLRSISTLTKDMKEKPWLDVGFVRLQKPLDRENFPPPEISSLLTINTPGKQMQINLTGYFYTDRAPGDSFPTTEACSPIRFMTLTKEFNHNCSTTHGMSGSPIYVIRDGHMILIGIHEGSLVEEKEPVPFSEKVSNRAIDGEVVASALKKYETGQLYTFEF